MADGLEEPIVFDHAQMVPDQRLTVEKAAAIARGRGNRRVSNYW